MKLLYILKESFLNEIGDIINPYPWSKDETDDEGNVFYSFNSPGNEYTAAFAYIGVDVFECTFNTVGDMGLDTGEGVPLRILSTVMEIILDFIKKHSPNEIIFRPINTKEGKDNRRFAIYGAFLRKNIPSEYNIMVFGDTYRAIRKKQP